MKTPQALTFVVLFRLALSALPVEAAQTITTTSVNGDILTVKLIGPGFVSCSLGTDGTGLIDQLLVRGTDEKSALTIKVKKSKSGDGRVRINSIKGDSSLGELHADSADIFGPGISFDGSIGMLAIGNLINSAIDLGGKGIRAGAPSLGTLSVAGLISNSVVNVNGTITTVNAKRVVNSEIAAGYRPSATNNPMGGGTFKVAAQIKRVTILGTGASSSPAFVNSVIAASEIEDVTIESARCDNGGHPFGVLADRKIGRVQVTTPQFSYSAKEAWGRAMGDFIVDPGLAVIITANTRILAEADLSKAVISTNLLVLDPTGSSAQGLVPGDILVGTTNHPFLSRVVSVKHVGGQLEIAIQPARLSDAIRRGSLHLSIPLSPDRIKYRASGVKVRNQAPFAVSSGSQGGGPRPEDIVISVPFSQDFSDVSLYGNGPLSVTFSGIADLEPIIDINAQWGVLSLESVSVTTSLAVNALLDITVSGALTTAREVPLIDYAGVPIVTAIGPVPVEISPFLKLSAGFDAGCSAALEAEASANGQLTAGVQWSSASGWSPISSDTLQFKTTLSDSVGGQLDGYIKAEVGADFYEAVGPDLSVTVGANLDGNLNQAGNEFCWSLTGYLDGDVGIDFGFLGDFLPLPTYNTQIWGLGFPIINNDCNPIVVTQTGSLEVMIGPPTAVNSGAQWRVDNGPWQNTGVTLSGLPAGSHTVGFNSVSGWASPAPQSVNITASSTSTISGTYTPSSAVQGSGLSLTQTNWTNVGDGDPYLEGFELTHLTVTVFNNMSVTAGGVQASLSSPIPAVMVDQGLNPIWDIPPRGSQTYGFNLTLNQASGSGVTFFLTNAYQSNGVPLEQSFTFFTNFSSIGSQQPAFAVDQVTILDTNDNGDGIFQSGEQPNFALYLKNCGTVPADNVTVAVTNLSEGSVNGWTPGVYPAFYQYGNMSNDCSVHGPAQYAPVATGIPENFVGPITGDVVIQYGGANGVQAFTNQVLKGVTLFNVQPAAWVWVTAPSYGADPLDPVNFGISGTSSNIVIPCVIANPGSADLYVSNIVTSSADTTWTSITNALPWIIPPGGTQPFLVQINPEGLAGQITKQVTVVSDGRATIGHPAEGQANVLTITGLISDTLPVFQVPGSSNVQMGGFDCSSNTIVWQDGQNVYSYGISSGASSLVYTASNGWLVGNVRVSGNLVAWENIPNGSYDLTNVTISALNLSSGASYSVSSTQAAQSLIGVDGQFVAYMRRDYLLPGMTLDAGTYTWGIYNCYLFSTNGSTTALTSLSPNGTNLVQSVDSPYDFGGGNLGFVENTWNWMGTYWNYVGGTNYLVKFSPGSDSVPVQIFESRYGLSAVAANDGDIAYLTRVGNDGANGVWLWNGGSPTLITSSLVIESGSPIALGTGDIVYSENSQGLYYWDLTRGIEGLVSAFSGSDNSSPRMDGQTLVWQNSGVIYFTVFNQPVISVSPSDITVVPPMPLQNRPFNVGLVVRNTSSLAQNGSMIVQLFDGDPIAGGLQLGTNAIISGGLSANSSAQVQFSNIVLQTVGTNQLYIQLGLPIAAAAAAGSFVVDVIDPDLSGPIIGAPTFTAYPSGSSQPNSSEKILISCSVMDADAIISMTFSLDRNLIPITTTNITVSSNGISVVYSTTVGPLATGMHQLQIQASDADIPPKYSGITNAFSVLPPGAAALTFGSGNGQLTLTWPGTFYLQTSTNLSNPVWIDVGCSNGPFVLTTSEKARFFRLSEFRSTNTVSPATNCVQPPNGIVAWWPADGNANDVIGTNNGALMGSATFAQGEVGQAFSFNGSNAYVQVPQNNLWAFGTNDFSIELWANFSTNQSATLICDTEGGGENPKWDFTYANDQLYFHYAPPYNGNIAVSAAFTPVLGFWYHLALTRSGNVWTIFTNGVVVSTGTDSPALPTSITAPLTIGASPSDDQYYMNGLLDEISIYNTALSGSQIQAIYNAGSAGKCK